MTDSFKKNIEDILALTPMQEGMLYHYLREPGNQQYFEQLSLKISGQIEVEIFAKAWNFVIDCNEILRAVFQWEKVEHPIQIILKKHILQPDFYDFSDKDPNEAKKLLEEFKINDRKREFTLRQVPFRVSLCKLKEDGWEMIISNHHILYDGWSNGIILKEFFNAYSHLAAGIQPLKPVKTGFKEFIKWIQTQDITRQEKFWQNYLKGFDTQTEIPVKQKNRGKKIKGAGKHQIRLNKKKTARLEGFIKQQKVTLASLLYMGWGVLLQGYNNSNDVIFGTTVSGRSAKVDGIENIIGLFINTLPMRVETHPGEKIGELLARIDESLQAREPFETTPLVNIKKYSEIDNKGELFDTIIVLENYPLESRFMQENSKLLLGSFSMFEMTHYDLMVGITVFDGIEFIFTYNKEVFADDTVVRMADHFCGILQEIIKNPGRKVSAVEIISGKEKRQILEEFNRTNHDYPKDKTIVQLFAEQAEKTPGYMALVGMGSCPGAEGYQLQLTYGELKEKAGQLGGLLQRKGLQRDNIAAVMAERSIEMMIGIFGILNAGGSYLPLDPAYPVERISYILRDSAAHVLLSTAPRGTVEIGGFDRDIIYLEEFNTPTPARISQPSALYREPLPKALAYVIYTSGSTGKPKGAMIEHPSLLNRLNWMQRCYPLGKNDVILQKTPVVFDVSVWELFWWSIQGASLCLLGAGEEKNPAAIVKAIKRNKVTTMHFVPSMLNVFLDNLEQAPPGLTLFTGLRQVFASGEALLPHQVEKFYKLVNKAKGNSPAKLINLYGPTEATIDVSYFNCQPGQENRESVPIGKPIDNTGLFVVNRDFRLQPIGIPGELCISGIGLARGYLNQPELTAEKFIYLSNRSYMSYKTYISKKIYKTGDLACWLADGNIEFLGRLDHQVKIRGFRVELGEIQGQLLNHNQIKAAAAAVKQDRYNERHLCGYYVSEQEIPAAELKAHLSRQLPDYMIPAFFVRLQQLPLTRNGKVDNAALPEPAREQLQLETTFLAPQNHLEKRIAAVWKKILKIDKIGVNDNFFDIGGNSLSIIRLSSRLKEVFQQEIPLVTLFNYPTVKAQARYFNENGKGSLLRKGVSVEEKIGTAGPGGEIAVIGMAGRFPGAANIAEFWNNIKNGMDSISFFSDEELQAWGVDQESINNPNYVKAKGVLPDTEKFDAAFFDYSAREARLMDPQMRILHECVWEALENAGYVPGAGSGSIGLYVGAMTNSWRMLQLSRQMNSHSDLLAMGSLNDRDFLATRVSYKLDLRGPVLTVQTACSTSLAAVDAACQALLLGKCSMALAGGISLTVEDRAGYLYEDGMVRSPDGHCRPFDAGANGTTGGNGVGIVLLKPLAAAAAQGDHIRALIKSSAINNDGARKVGYTAPSVEGQVKVIRTALKAAGAAPETITYLETHGTGTALGDPVEIEALKKAFDTDKKGFCAVGAVKANVGHLDTAAGVTGLIKTVLALEHRMIPPMTNFESPNPRIDFTNSPFYANTCLREWKNEKYPLRAGVSSFGIGGTNVHVILEEAPSAPKPAEKPGKDSRAYQLIVLSAKTMSALDKMTANLAAYLKNDPRVNLPDAAYTLKVGREAFKYRRMLVGTDVNQVSAALSSLGSTKLRTACVEKENPPVVFMFPGLGSQYVNMGWELYQTEPLFREEMDRCFEILKPLLDYDIKEILYPEEAVSGVSEMSGNTSSQSPGLHTSHTSHMTHIKDNHNINRFEIAQVVVFILEYALARLLIKWGIYPDAMIGYSFGEYSAACLAGVFSLEDTLKLVVQRGRLIRGLPGGAMMSVPLTVKEVERLLAEENENQLSIAIDNGSSCVVSGPEAAIGQFEEQMKKNRCLCMRLPVSHALHSRMMEPVVEEFKAVMGRISLNKPQIPYISNVTGTWLTEREATSPGYWAHHLRKTVRFGDGLKELLSEPDTLFIEVGPGHELSALLVRHLGRDNSGLQPVLNLVKHPERQESDVRFLLNKLGILWLKGVPIDWSGFYRQEKRHRLPLPTYPFEGRRYSSQEDFNKPAKENIPKQAAKRKKPDIADWFYLPQWERSYLLPLPEQGSKSPGQSCWLVFTENSGFCEKLLRRLGQDRKALIGVLKGRGFRKIDPQTYEIDPQQSNDYDRLMEEIRRTGQRPSLVLHLWNIPGGEAREPDRNAVDDGLALGSVSLLYLARAIARQGFAGDTRIDILTATVHEVIGQEPLSPQKAPILGMAKVIPQEYNSITCRCIDIVLPAPGSAAEKKLIRQLLEEFQTNSAEVVIAYRANYRWIQVYKPIRFLEQNPEPGQRLRKKGVYLITGGLGNIGFTLSQYLAENLKAKLVLTGRTMLPDREEWENNEEDKTAAKIRKIRILEESGAEVLYFNCDTADPEAMQKLVTVTGERFGQINGVIHAAVPGNLVKPAADMDIAEIKRQFQTKVYGVILLANLFRDKKLDFGIFISSNSPILGGMGYGAYASANRFTDAFIYWFNRVNTTPWLAVNWGEWAFLEDSDQKTLLNNPLGYLLMTPEQGIKTFERILAYYPINQVVVSTVDLQERINQWVRLEFKGEQEKEPRDSREEKSTSTALTLHHARPDLMTPYLEPTNHMEKILSGIWQTYFGLDQVGIEDNFFELGATSLDIIQLNRKVKEVIGRDIPVSTFFRYPNISSLARYLGQQEIDTKQPAPAREASRSHKMQKARSNLQRRAKILKV